MRFRLFKVSGYEEAIMSLRMSKGKFYSFEKARDIQQLVYAVTDDQGFMVELREDYENNLESMGKRYWTFNEKITGNYEEDVNEFKRLLGLTFNNSMRAQKHHTLMKYIDISFFTEGLHRGAQDDLDAHAIAFNNRITRFSTRLAEIDSVEISEWYKGKVIPFYKAIQMINNSSHEVNKGITCEEDKMPEFKINLPPFIQDEDGNNFRLTPFGYIIETHAKVPAKNGLAKDVQRGLMPLGMPSNAIWKTDIFNLRYIYKMRSKLTKANPELKEGMEQIADQIENHIPVFGEYFRKEYTDSNKWEHTNKVKTITTDEYNEYKHLKKDVLDGKEFMKKTLK